MVRSSSLLSSNPIAYGVLTLHQPSNVDDREVFEEVVQALSEVSRKFPIVFPVHPRTLNRIKEFHFEKYFDFLNGELSIRTQNSHIYGLDPWATLIFYNSCLMQN